MIELNEVKVVYDDYCVLDIPFLQFEDGKSYLIKGESGTGKTTLFNIISGLKLPDEGNVFVSDVPINTLSERERDVFRAENVGYIFQDFNLLDGFTSLGNVIVPMTFLKQKITYKKACAAALKALESVGLEDKANVKINKLSGGEKQRVAIARATVNFPKVLLADEPTGNLDRNNARKIMEELLSASQKTGATLLVISHDLSFGDMFDNVLDIYDFNKGGRTL